MTLKQLKLLIDIELKTYQYDHREDKDLMILQKARLISESLDGEYDLREPTRKKLAAILQLL